MRKVTYIAHSGFQVECDTCVCIFDYYQGELPLTDPDKKVYVFVSHDHHDHFNPVIFGWKKRFPDITYILSDDIHSADPEARTVIVSPRQKISVDDLTVRTLRSTDEGVAFLVQVDGCTVYHGGDLNWWHWDEEGKAFNEMMKRRYCSEIQKLSGEQIDIAFVPLDSRQGEQFYWGMDYFMRHTDTRIVFPMHMCGDYGVADRLGSMEISEPYRDRIVRIAAPGQVFWAEGE